MPSDTTHTITFTDAELVTLLRVAKEGLTAERLRAEDETSCESLRNFWSAQCTTLTHAIDKLDQANGEDAYEFESRGMSRGDREDFHSDG